MKFSQQTMRLGVSIAVSMCAGYVSAQSYVDEVERSIVRVVIGGHATGWVVSPGIVATNWRVFDGSRTFEIYPAGTDEEFRGELLWQGDEDLDIGLIEVPGLTLEPFSLFTGDAPRGSDSYTVGFPGLGDNVTGRANTNVSVYDGTVALVTENTAGVRIIQHTNIVNAGNSGGPLLDNCGRVLGLTTWGVENEQYQADFIWASVHVSELAAQLDVLGISYETDNKPCLGSDITQQDLDALHELQHLQQTQAAPELAQAEFQQTQADLEPLGSTFLMAMIRWDSVADVDLHVIDPAGNEFSWRNPSFPGVPGELTIDIVEGPGVEVYEEPGARPGTFQVLYNLFDGAPVQVDGVIYTRQGRQELPPIFLQDLGLVPVARVTVNADGTVDVVTE